MKSILRVICLATLLANAFASDFQSAASATNSLGLDLYRKLATGEGNLCLSPYSIESALAMTLAGADGETRTEMARALHLSATDEGVNSSFSALQKSLEAMAVSTAQNGTESKRFGGSSEPITLTIANRLFAQKDYDFREKFLAIVKTNFGAPMELLDFAHDAPAATKHINDWVAEQTRQRIRDLIPPNALDETTRMVLTNALYLKAPWADPFEKEATEPQPFQLKDGQPIEVPMMHQHSHAFGYAKKSDYTAVSLPYSGGDLRFVVLLPDATNGLSKLEAKLTSEMLAECTKLSTADINLSFPKFKMEPPTTALKAELEALGMKSAFDDPAGSANFDRLARRRPNEYLYLSKVFHKTFIAVDEKGTEAAAATAAVVMQATSAMQPSEPIEVKVDRPFLYAIQQSSTGVCLFLGRVTDPR